MDQKILRRFKFNYTHLVVEHDSLEIVAENHLEAENAFDQSPELVGLDNVEVTSWSDLGQVIEDDPNQLKMEFNEKEVDNGTDVSKTTED
jgi:hypothetical protein